MRPATLVAFAAAALVLLSGCGSQATPAGQALAARACQSSGVQAASLAQDAASQNSRFAGLAADEQSAAANDQSLTAAQSDGNDDDDLGALVKSESLGTSSGQKVLGDCVDLGLSVLHH